ncbi:putative neutral ceramidase C [Clavelina lepadiformis]|uniref:putative neutral ceramidase C n=1 Tax=Clavelina lepadiformis TaxID=159417 RepID=UPI0040427F89
MGKKKEVDTFVSTPSLAFRFVFGFLFLAILAGACFFVGYEFGVMDIFSKGKLEDNLVDPDTVPEPTPGNYLIGVGRTDVTGPIVQVNMMGYANPSQIAQGLHQRLYSRTFIVSDLQNKSRVVFVTVDNGMASQIVKLEVIKKLQAKYGNTYNERNVVISGTHSHSGPAGYFQTLLIEVTSLGAVKETTDTFINGIFDSIVKAHSNMREGKLFVGTDDVVEGNINRSPSAYLHDPEGEREKYNFNTEQEMTMLKFQASNGQPIGAFTWFPVHGTSMNFSNHLISSDNRGRASALFEKMMRKPGEELSGNESFVAAFASANLGDVSPRTKGPICVDTGKSCDFAKSTCGVPPRVQKCNGFGPGVDMFDSTDIIANRQFETSKLIYNKTGVELEGSVGWVHQYVDMSKATVKLDDGTTVTTCKPGMGYSFAAGTTDGPGAFDFTQSMTEGTFLWDTVRDEIIVKVVCSTPPPTEYYDCHRPKPVLLPTGYMDKPYAWHPHIVDVQMLKIGQLIIIAVPGEFTTMAGRRIKDAIAKEAIRFGVHNPKVVLAGLSNVYTHYITTPEEYEAQRYEGASTIFGPHTFQAYYQTYSSLVGPLVTAKQDNVSRGPAPDNILSEQIQLLPPPFPDRVPDGKNFGDVITDVNSTYKPGEKASVSFYGANPRHNMKLESTYLAVEQLVNKTTWKTVYVDTDWSTIFQWDDGVSGSNAVERNVITAIFDIIHSVFDIHFEYEKAMQLYDEGEFQLTESLNDLINDGVIINRRSRAIQDLTRLGVLRFNADKTNTLSLKELPTVESHVTIDWWVPDDQPSGTYRITYYGDHKDQAGTVTSFVGHSSQFQVQAA